MPESAFQIRPFRLASDAYQIVRHYQPLRAAVIPVRPSAGLKIRSSGARCVETSQLLARLCPCPDSSCAQQEFRKPTHFRGVDRHGLLRSTRLSDRAVVDTIKCRAAAIGLDRSVAGHSLRSGFATEAYAQRTPELHHAPRPLEVGKSDAWPYQLIVLLGETRQGRRPSGQDFMQSRALVRADH